MNVEALGWTLLHFLWQGAAVAAVLASLHLVLRRAAPQVRYLLASAALALMALLPVATFLSMQGAPASGPPPLAAMEPVEAAAPVTALGQAAGALPDVAAGGGLRASIQPALP